MVPPAPALRPAVWEEWLASADDRAVEIVDGELVEKAAPGFDHGIAQLGLGAVLFGFRGPGGGPRGPGGWWIGTEVDIAYDTRQLFRHDLAGWRRERLLVMPTERPVTTRPDWVCEILSPSNAATDTVKKLRVLHRHAVPHYWLLDPQARTLRVLRYTAAGYLEITNATVGETIRAEPFEAIELSLSEILDVG